MLYPYKDKIVAAGIDDARFLEELYPGLRFVHADALDLPFEDGAFDYVHSSAVLEHVGCFENQRKMVAECARVARKGFCLTTSTAGFRSNFTPNCRFCTGCRRHGSDSSLRRLEQPEIAKEENLNLMSERDLRKTVAGDSGWSFRLMRLGCWG